MSFSERHRRRMLLLSLVPVTMRPLPPKGREGSLCFGVSMIIVLPLFLARPVRALSLVWKQPSELDARERAAADVVLCFNSTSLTIG
jgi:hypothetical protein